MKKTLTRRMVCLLIACLLLGLSACGLHSQTPVGGAAAEAVHFSAPAARQETASAPEAAQLPEGATLLTEQELRWFGGSLFNVLPQQGPNLFLSASFQDSARFPVAALFAAGAGRPATEQELRQLNADSALCLTVSELEDLLLRCTGLSLAQLEPAAFDGVTYLADFDAYYVLSGGQPSYVRFLYGYRDAQGLVTLRYADGAVTLRPEGGRWLLCANSLDAEALR